MQLSNVLSEGRIIVDRDGARVKTKATALHLLAELLAPAVGVDVQAVEQLLAEREQLQSTAIGDGVAIPHTAIDHTDARAAALLLCPKGLDFDAIDGAPAHIIFGVIGPRQATGEHLRILARVSRLLRDPATRSRLLESGSAHDAFKLIEDEDREFQGSAQ
jgi:PTS system nitrogen regulatory IIA component